MNKTLPAVLAILLLILPVSAALAADTTIQLGTADNCQRNIVEFYTGTVLDLFELSQAKIGGFESTVWAYRVIEAGFRRVKACRWYFLSRDRSLVLDGSYQCI